MAEVAAKTKLHSNPVSDTHIDLPAVRIWEIDALRGVAIVMMVLYHLLWDLYFFNIMPAIALQSGFWKYFQRTTASMFIFLVGVSLVVSYNRARQQQKAVLFTRFLWRGLRIFGWGMVISLMVWLAGIGNVDFGVLHLIGFSIVAAYPFLRFRWLNIGLWALFFIVGYLLQSPVVDFTWLVWLGLKPPFYSYVDYFPVIPWFGVVLLGVGTGNLLYGDNQRLLTIPDWSGQPPIHILQVLGRHSLLIYLLHQPILFVIVLAFVYLLR